jgi:hypothetical protein
VTPRPFGPHQSPAGQSGHRYKGSIQPYHAKHCVSTHMDTLHTGVPYAALSTVHSLLEETFLLFLDYYFLFRFLTFHLTPILSSPKAVTTAIPLWEFRLCCSWQSYAMLWSVFQCSAVQCSAIRNVPSAAEEITWLGQQQSQIKSSFA